VLYLTGAKGFWNSRRVARPVGWDLPEKTDPPLGSRGIEQTYFRIDEICEGGVDVEGSGQSGGAVGP
jgi:hypothetical protein